LERRLIAYCIAGFLLGVVVLSLPLTVMTYRTEITSEQRASYQNTQSHETRNGVGGSLLGVAVGVGFIVSLGLVFASSVFIILKRYVMGRG